MYLQFKIFIDVINKYNNIYKIENFLYKIIKYKI